MKLAVETLEALFLMFFVAVVLLELGDLIQQSEDSRATLVVAGVLLMSVTGVRLAYGAITEWVELFRGEETETSES